MIKEEQNPYDNIDSSRRVIFQKDADLTSTESRHKRIDSRDSWDGATAESPVRWLRNNKFDGQ